MRHLLGGVAIAALLAAGLSAHAQTSGTDRQKPAPSASSGAQSGATTPSDTTGQTGKAKTGKHAGKSKHAMTRRGGTSPEDNMAEELNRRELENVMRSAGQAPSSGTSQGSSTPSTAPATAPPKQ